MTAPSVLELLRPIFLADPSAKHYGYELMDKVGLKSGSLYPVLWRLQDEGYLRSEWGAMGNHPNRKYYQLTEAGERFFRDRG